MAAAAAAWVAWAAWTCNSGLCLRTKRTKVLRCPITVEESGPFGPLFYGDDGRSAFARLVGVSYQANAMPLEVDHAFVACAAGAPEGDALLRAGFVEGSPNTHLGQGTANRRFFFENFMLELIWVADPAEAQSAQTRRTRLWERCSQRDSGTSPFGIVFRAAGDQDSAAPFPTWAYHPRYLPEGLAIQIAAGTALHEPELFYLPFLKMPGIRAGEPLNHAPPIRRVIGLRIGVPRLPELSGASRIIESLGLLRYFQSERPILEILFACVSDLNVDLRPALPLLFRGVA